MPKERQLTLALDTPVAVLDKPARAERDKVRTLPARSNVRVHCQDKTTFVGCTQIAILIKRWKNTDNLWVVLQESGVKPCEGGEAVTLRNGMIIEVVDWVKKSD